MVSQCAEPESSKQAKRARPDVFASGCRYNRPRRFFLHTSHPQLVQLRQTTLELPGGASAEVGIVISGRMQRIGVTEALVFINDESDRSEDCVAVRVSVVT